MQREAQEFFHRDMFMLGQHNLDYAKLFHNKEGGYDMDKLTRVLKYINTNQDDFWLEGNDPNANKKEEELEEAASSDFDDRIRPHFP